MVRRCEYCGAPVPADATVCPVCREEIAEETLERILPLLKRPESPDVRFMNPLERIVGVILKPAPTYRDIAQRPDMKGPFLIIIMNAFILVGFFLAMSSKLIINVNINGTITPVSILSSPYSGGIYLAALVSLLPHIMLGLVYLIIGSAFAHLAFKITGGRGSKRKTVSIIGYSMVPVLLFRLIAVVYVAVVAPTYNISNAANIVPAIMGLYSSFMWDTVDILTMASFFWVGFLLIFGIREAHDTSTLWAFIVSVLCIIVLMWTFIQVH